MWPFRRRREETLNEILLREAGLDGTDPPATEAAAPDEPQLLDRFASALTPDAVRAAARSAPLTPLDNVVTVVHAPGIGGDTVRFAALPNGDLIVEEAEGDGDLSALAGVVEQQLAPPYRATARRQEGDLWGVTAEGIEVVTLAVEAGDELDLTCIGGARTVRLDGEEWDGSVPELERIGEEGGPDYVVHADRLDGDLWEVHANPL
jgi:hypothetical protein